MLKQQLLKEAQEIEVSVELDGIFESANFSPEMEANFKTVFEQAVKAKAVELAESHIATIAESAETKIEESVEAKRAEIEARLVESADQLATHTAAEWLSENVVAINRNIKADLFESMFEGLKTLVVEHNVILPEESVDVVAELEEELTENKAEAARLFTSLNESKDELTELKRSVAVDKATIDLSENQKEKVANLIEGLNYNTEFDAKLTAIVEMAKGSKATQAATLNEAAPSINTINESASGLNYVVESVPATKPAPAPKTDSPVNKYVAAAKRI
ncbi:head scaffolding protein [Acinetobacter phage Acj9]|uniref:Gp22 prohead core scaffold protein n=1 Tax=Acinetobacter phage Acj9 TaxID=760939 RepID=E5EPW8_9CAUD|nr:head scaffolding protein [Acinetobacter phage Acj9]ADG60084.1 gp22 prohead core scaffold protein [Acinetobacter phage Acj9]